MSTSFLERIKIPHVFVLLLGVILFCSVLTYFIPSGEYNREERTVGTLTRTMVVPGTYQTIPKHYSAQGILFDDKVEGKASPVSLQGFLSSVPRGMEQAADIIFFIFVIGGVFGILQRTGMIIALLNKLLNIFRDSGWLLTVIIMIVIAIGGSTLGMGEEFIPLVPLFLIVSKELGYDRIYGLAMVMLAADVGFASATTNPFTVQIAQGIAELPLLNDFHFRILFFVCIMAVALVYVLRYGAKIKKDPNNSYMPHDDFELEAHHQDIQKTELTNAHIYTFVVCLIIFVFILFAVQELGWWMAEMGGGFLLMGIAATIFSRLSIDEATKAFIKGMEEMVVAALVVGFAKGIQVVLDDAMVLDTLIFSAASLLRHFPDYVAAQGMLLFQTVLNFFIPSGSGQAAVTMPLMAPLADVLGITRQSAVFAFTCGDGFSNTIIPTSGVLMAMLALAKIPYTTWLRFMFPLFLQLMVVSAFFLFISVVYPVVWTW
ncbi:MAG: YfcC family protein [Calditrichaeota bacterium]|nr:YfcC family protein [Calditrichota bacterium]MCB9066834.1 putative basic amino acid antiporter YfcC [Calditrichia bacterium]